MYVETTERHASSTDYIVSGTLDEVLARIKEVFAEWHPMGYGTRVQSIAHTYGEPPYQARIARSNSCD